MKKKPWDATIKLQAIKLGDIWKVRLAHPNSELPKLDEGIGEGSFCFELNINLWIQLRETQSLFKGWMAQMDARYKTLKTKERQGENLKDQ